MGAGCRVKFIHEMSLSLTDLAILKDITHDNKKHVDLCQVIVYFHSNYVGKKKKKKLSIFEVKHLSS